MIEHTVIVLQVFKFFMTELEGFFCLACPSSVNCWFFPTDLVAGASTNAVTVSDVNLIDFEDSPTENNANTFTFNNELNDSFEHVEYANKNTQPSTDTQSETHNMGSLRLNLALASPQAGRGAISALAYAVNENAIIPSPSPPPSPVYWEVLCSVSLNHCCGATFY